MEACASCPVRETAICHALTADQLDELSRLGRQQTVRKGQTLQWEGDDSLLVANVVDGVVKMSASTWHGRDQTLGIAYSGDFVGRPFGTKNQQSVTALTDAQLCTFPRSGFDEFAGRHPNLEHGLLERALSDLDQARGWMLLLGSKTAAERVATFLLDTSMRLADDRWADHPDQPIAFVLPFSRQEIAEVLGLTVETVSRQITLMRQEGIIGTAPPRTITIFDRKTLEAWAATS